MSEIQKERAVIDEKLANAESKRDEVKQKYENEITYLKEQLTLATDALSKDRDIFIQDNERLKIAHQELERELSEVTSSYERDKALWENKFQFLEQQKEQAKSDL